MIYELDGITPEFDSSNTFIAESADIIGKVKLGANCSVWFNTVIRGDTDWITLGENTNVQDCAVLHTDPGLPMNIGKGVTIGHKAMLHGCQVGDFSLIGINSVILNGAVIGHHTLIGANSLITEGKEFPSGVLILGNPAKVVRDLTPDELKKLEKSASVYTNKAKNYLVSLKKVE
ncbi:MAG: gamma carbonic anhydrase family protein [Gammaproteobacteria bacterium]|nr:gamma carbonic anhydrase family protein [Gammaproteobacteria bacterium]